MKEKKRVYAVMNTIIPRGDGVCAHCRPGYPCRSCSSKIDTRRWGVCSRCDGKGIDKFGLHCCQCKNSYDEWGASKHAFKIRDLFETIAQELSKRA